MLRPLLRRPRQPRLVRLAASLTREETKTHEWFRGYNRAEGKPLEFDIQTFNAISAEGLAHFPNDYKVSPDLRDPHAILLRSHKLQEDEVPLSVRAIARCGAGTNNIPVDAMTARGIPVFNTPGANANAVKELVLCSLLLSSRGVYEGHRHMEKMWTEEDDTADGHAVVKKRVEKEKKFFRGQELAGKTLGVIGLGHIGRLVASGAEALGMKIVGYDPAISVDTAWQLPRTVTRAEEIEDLLKVSDYVTLHAPYIKDATHHLLNAETMALLKPTCHILNFARDELVDSEALKALYDQGEFKGKYLCDFAVPALHGGDYPVVMVPHLGASTEEAETNSATMAAKQITLYLEHGIIKNSVNFPECVPPMIKGDFAKNLVRLNVVNQNEKNFLAKLTTVLGQHKCNIVQHINTSRGKIAYNVFDLGAFPDDPKDLQRDISQIEGIVSTRIMAGDPGAFFHVTDPKTGNTTFT